MDILEQHLNLCLNVSESMLILTRVERNYTVTDFIISIKVFAQNRETLAVSGDSTKPAEETEKIPNVISC